MRLPLPQPPYDPALAARLQGLMPVRSALPPLALFRLLATDAPLSDAMKAMGAFHLRPDPQHASAVPAREREIVILRSCARCGCAYEWGVHASAYGPRVGLTDAQLQASWHGGADDPAWSDADRSLLRLVDELHDGAQVSDATWQALRRHVDDRQALQLLSLVGWYHLVCFICNGVRLAPEPWAADPALAA